MVVVKTKKKVSEMSITLRNEINIGISVVLLHQI